MMKSSNIFRGQNQPEKRDARSQSPSPTHTPRRCHLNQDLVPAEENLNRIDGFLMIPSSLLTEQPYRELPGESKLLYGHLLGLLRLSAQDTTGRWKANGRPCVSLSRANAGRLLHCQREKAAGLFTALAWNAAVCWSPCRDSPTERSGGITSTCPGPRNPTSCNTRRKFRPDLSEKRTGS